MKLKRLQTKIALWSGICLLLTAGFIIIYSANAMNKRAKITREQAITEAYKNTAAAAKQYANHVRAELEIAMDAARTLAQTFSGIRDQKVRLEIGREEANGILRIILAQNPRFIGIYTCWEPDAFDDMDIGYINDTGHDETGRFIPYWTRDETGEMKVKPLTDYDNNAYYLEPRKTKNEFVLDPYLKELQGEMIPVTSLIVPIIANEAFYGIVGVDMKLNTLQEHIDDIDGLYDGTAQVSIISYNGILAAVSGKPELIGKSLKEIHKDWEADLQLIHKGETIVEKDEGRIAVFTPVNIGRSTTPWSVNINIPMEKVIAPATAQMNQANHDIQKMTGICMLYIICALVLLWFLAGGIARPIRYISYQIKKIADGDLTRKIDIRSHDEMGELADGLGILLVNFQGMIQNIIHNVTLLNTSAQALSDISGNMAEGTGNITNAVWNVNLLTEETALNINAMASAAEEMSANIQSISSTGEQISQNINVVATAMEEMSVAIKDIARIAQEGTNISHETVEMSKNAALTMKNLSDAAKEIGDVTEMIKRIAEQTNLLALNATIEAASAGDAGKGFAVVANEIKLLANQSAGAAENITERITNIQKNTTEAALFINNMTAIIENANRSSTLILDAVEQQTLTANDISANAQQVNTGVRHIAASIAELSKGADDIAAKTGETAKSANEITDGIRRIGSAAGDADTTTKQVDTSAGELKAMAEKLRQMVERFKV